mmetsp:Transcript_2272/g.3474  ORF Transcript_2272/g.3474 Transcript_2272/m.3474 type:complete len:498 (+) Transcript_2272:202-1695(+)
MAPYHHQALSKTLYRTLLRSTKHYTSPRNGPILSSLLYRSGSDDEVDYTAEKHVVSKTDETSSSTHQDIDDLIHAEEARDLSKPYKELLEQRKKREASDEEGDLISETGRGLDASTSEERLHTFLYRGLLKEIIGTHAHMNFPFQAEQGEDNVMTRLKDVIRREFKGSDDSLSKTYSGKIRRDTAFSALKELQKKLTWAETLGLNLDDDGSQSREIDNLVAKGVVRLPLNPTSAYLKTGTFLVAHPLLTGCFAKSVICILQHTESQSIGEEDDGEHMGGTYGLIVNKPLKIGVPNHDSNQSRDRTLREVIRYDCLPEGIKLAFGDNRVRNGGPVNMSMQMIRTSTIDEEEKWKLGGTVLSMVGDGCSVEDVKDEVTSTAMDTDSAIYFGGDIIKAAQAVIDNGIQEENFSFIAGASCWEPGQLENEIKKGYWIPCAGPPDIAFSGSCVVNGAENMSVADSSLWVSTMASLGEQEGRMAQIIEDFVEYDENGLPCDEF